MKQCGNVTPKRNQRFLTGQATNRGFTLIELLVVISIIVILTGIVLVSYRAGEQQLALQRAANKLAQDIRRVQEMAMSAKESQKIFPPGVPLGGYGIHLTRGENQYIIYSDGGNEKWGGAGDFIEENIGLEKGVFIKNIEPPAASFSINFKPPDPIIRIVDAAGVDKDNVAIILALEADSNKIKKIRVNKAGRIEID
ncbi:MAG TPA: prepilin-type N-terminal cleavage/methylation domain-containing protein [Candidatus Nealsonbacteria bacterium]|uniref:General secretion pathway GspH domain-containing protein n=1 Tax=marine sediment metagenome TaxID=412755 RepID=A0A0F9WZ99_9ZZZZ|nr:prepilin-type N-terminal cleavage/methylation domain-containing protein [Candidatus Nealsonbacteria bacterium]HEB46171.1 prepilin-type N-terminal cleavage/methylation domain-containing protein [Candidatus Nealsonbacteria bacterium]